MYPVTNPSCSKKKSRYGAAVLELAVLLPFLCFVFVVAVDWCRLFYHYTIVTNCARNGAAYASSPMAAAKSQYSSSSEAALADAGDLSPQPNVSSTTGKDKDGNAYVEVTVSYTFHSITNFPGIPGTVSLSRTVRMRQGL
jgi:Flp pilus assembly protein TadG